MTRSGVFTSRGEVERFLNTWVNRYVVKDDTASQEIRAQYPLREARVDVIDDPARPGGYKAVAFLRPHFQLDEPHGLAPAGDHPAAAGRGLSR